MGKSISILLSYKNEIVLIQNGNFIINSMENKHYYISLQQEYKCIGKNIHIQNKNNERKQWLLLFIIFIVIDRSITIDLILSNWYGNESKFRINNDLYKVVYLINVVVVEEQF